PERSALLQPPPTATLRSPTPPAVVRYRVGETGEPLYAIAQKTLQNGNRWQDIYQLNRSLNPAQPVPANTATDLPADAVGPQGTLPGPGPGGGEAIPAALFRGGGGLRLRAGHRRAGPMRRGPLKRAKADVSSTPDTSAPSQAERAGFEPAVEF